MESDNPFFRVLQRDERALIAGVSETSATLVSEQAIYRARRVVNGLTGESSIEPEILVVISGKGRWVAFGTR